MEKNSLGQSIDSYCGKCKQNLDHTIMAMEGETIAKVRCKNCGGSHKFRGPLAAQKVRKAGTKKGDAEGATSEIVWRDGLAKAKGIERDYAMAAAYGVGDVVNHQRFGKGVVIKLYTNKCNMLFKDGERLMASANE